jgi:phosphoglycerate dehydrogenase-like enzyme
MATGKVVLITRGRMRDDEWAIFQAKIPPGWQVTVTNRDEGEDELIETLRDAEYLIYYRGGDITPRLVEGAKNLKLIQTCGQDTGNLPVEYALSKGIYAANAGGANAISVAEHTISLMMNCMKRIFPFNQSLREGRVRGNLGRKGSYELYGKNVGIVGLGNIGRRVAKLCFAFGANILYNDIIFIPPGLRADFKGTPVNLHELLTQADIVTLHIPALKANRAMIGWEQLTRMKPTAFFINTSRGANVDEKALGRALEEKRIAGAGIDVWDPDPPDPNNPLLHMPNVVATPHIGANTWEVLAPSFEMAWHNVMLVSEGKEPLNRVLEC